MPNGDFGENNKGGKLLVGTMGVVAATYTLLASAIAVSGSTSVGSATVNSIGFVSEIQSLWGGVSNITDAMGGPALSPAGSNYISGSGLGSNVIDGVDKFTNNRFRGNYSTNIISGSNSALEFFIQTR